MNNSVVRRSWLVIPGYERNPVEYVYKFLPDVIVLDLEYNVPPRRKQEARANLGFCIRSLMQCPSEIFVRVDWKTRWCDIKAAICPGLRGIILSGPELEEDILEIDELIDDCEQKMGVIRGSVELALILESPKGLWNALKLAKASSRITTLGVGRVDLTMNLGYDPEGDIHIYPYLLSRVLVTARALGKQPLGAHWRQGSRGGVATPEQTYEATRRARLLGFTGCLCAKPEQVTSASDGFTPTNDEVRKGTSMLEEFERTFETERAYKDIGGRLYDKAKIEACRALILFYRACKQRDDDKAHSGKGEVKK